MKQHPGDAEFDRFAGDYDRMLADSLPVDGGDNEVFAAYKVGEVAIDVGPASPVRVLDFGCGIGRSLVHLGRAFPRSELWGYDPSQASLDQARERAQGARLCAETVSLPEGAFDVVFMANVLHHVPLDARPGVLADCRRLLAEKGSLWVFEHNPRNFVTRRVFDACPFDRGASMLQREETIALGTRAGLRPTRAAYTLFLPLAHRAWLRCQRALAWLPLGAQYCVRFTR
ncbi:MAG: class I SAM-dependent methyltransferase [Burkholderiales bacterium]